jgi:transposase-like protein
MRYAQRGGYTPVEQQRRLRLQTAGQFARGDAINEIAHDLRVTPGSVRRWHRAWRNATLFTVVLMFPPVSAILLAAPPFRLG